MFVGQSKELVVKEKPAPEEDEGEPMVDEEKDKVPEEEKDKDGSKVEEKPQPEMLLLTSAPKV